MVPNRPTPFNSHMPRACNILRSGSHRRGGERLPLLPHCLQGSPSGQPPQRLWGFGDPLHLLLGNVPLSTLLNIPPVSSTQHESAPQTPHPTAPMAPGPSAPSKQQHPSPARLYPHLNWKPPQEWPLRSHPTQREGMKHLFTKH